MSKLYRSYSFTNHVFVTLGGYRVGGWGLEGGIEFEYASDLAEYEVSTDGGVTSWDNTNEVMIATLTLHPSQLGYKNVADLMQAQIAQRKEGAQSPLEFLMEDDRNGDKVTEQYATFLTRPIPSKNRKPGEVSFKILLPNAAGTAKFGVNIGDAG